MAVLHKAPELGIIQRPVNFKDGAVFPRVGEKADQVRQVVPALPPLGLIHPMPHVLKMMQLRPVGFDDGVDVGVRYILLTEKAAVVAAGLHHQREIGKLRRPLVNVQPVYIVLENQIRYLPLGITLAEVYLIEHVKGIHQNMTAAHTGVDNFDLRRVIKCILPLQLAQLLFHRFVLFSFINIINPILA
ncbi:MAG: hypothetical protein A4E52_00619 [Pelotomaculum sp. PtaB.Bin013]|nr:MAG: hypothetical protein A4E52_00619 [Pelotomaculum sp. PtaB.Bin013]